MAKTLHFEELWERCEKTHVEETNVSSILDELAMKINLYKAISERTDLAGPDLEKVKSRTMGEILFTLTNLSLKDNINVFEALDTSQKYHNAEIIARIPRELRDPGT